MSEHTICHIEFQTVDLDRAQAFYGKLFAWKFQSFLEEMVTFGKDETHIGGLLKVDAVNPADYAVAWFNVTDIDSTLEAVTAAGGKVKAAKSPVPHVGWAAEFTDLDGNPIGIVQFDR